VRCRKKVAMSEKDKPIGTAEVGMVAIGRAAARQPTDAEIQAGILRSMRDVVARPYNPNALRRPDRVGVANAPEAVTAGEPKRGTGWAKEAPIESPMPKGSFIEGVVGGMIDRALGPAVPKKREESAG
jgi:hypothetical protein